MYIKTITIIRGALHQIGESDAACVVSFEELKKWSRHGKILQHLLRYREARLITYRVELIFRPFLTLLLVRLLSCGSCHIEDELGQHQEVTGLALARRLLRLLRDAIQKPVLIQRVSRELHNLAAGAGSPKSARMLDLSLTPVYLRTDLWFGVRSGGSVGHIAGVLNHLERFCSKPIVLTTDHLPTVRADLEIHLITPREPFWDFPELLSLFFNHAFIHEGRRVLDSRRLAFLYQRYSVNNYAGVKLAKTYGVPFVLEYNGSEIWIGRRWGKTPRYEALCERIELLNLMAADVVVVVSQAMLDELVERGIPHEKILVNPNGVDTDRYSPDVDGSRVRRQYGLERKTVVGFIGTFGRWHGAEILAEAFGRLLQRFPGYREQVRLLMIGDGMTMPLAKDTLAKFGVMDACVLTGRVPQEEGAAHLAACDLLASPHVPNPDGTPFFGSPTKLFEYMAMGKGIVASDLDQIGQILKHQQTACMVKPGDSESLMLGLKALIDDAALRRRLGAASRCEVMTHYTWQEHTRKIIDKLRECCG